MMNYSSTKYLSYLQPPIAVILQVSDAGDKEMINSILFTWLPLYHIP